MKNNKGITLVSLVVSVLVLMILSTITINVSIDAYNTMKVQNFISKLKVLQSKVDNFTQENVDVETFGFTKLSDLASNNTEDYDLFTQIIYNPSDYNIDTSNSWNAELDGDIDNYYYFTPEDLDENLGLKNQDMTVIINFKTRNIITKDFVKEDEIKYYRQYDLAGGNSLQYNEKLQDAKYTVTYIANGGENAPIDDNQYVKGTTVLVNFSEVPTKEGYTFVGWDTDAKATEATYTSTGTNIFKMGKENVILYAVWEETEADLT